METRKIFDANGDYHGVAVVEDLVITEVGSPFTYFAPTCNVVRYYLYNEVEATALAEGFIEGYERSRSERGHFPMFGCSSVGEDEGPVTNSASGEIRSLDVSSPPPWEQGMNSRGALVDLDGVEQDFQFFPERKKPWWARYLNGGSMS